MLWDVDAGGGFVGAPDGPSDIWAEPYAVGYPVLWWQLSPLPELPTFSDSSTMFVVTIILPVFILRARGY